MYDTDAIRRRLAEVVRSEGELTDAAADDIAFHMTDWLDDLSAYAEFCRNPESLSDEQLSSLLDQFLIHVPNHVAAAAKLFMDMPTTDVFGVGAVETKQAPGKKSAV